MTLKEVWKKIRSKGDAVIAAFLAAVVLRRFEGGNDQAAEELGKAAAAFAERFFEGELQLESLGVLKKVLSKESWDRASQYFKNNPNDTMEGALGKFWQAVRDGSTYWNLEEGVWVQKSVDDPLELFRSLFEDFFAPQQTDAEIHRQLERLYQANTWQRFVKWCSGLWPGVASFIHSLAFVSPRTLGTIAMDGSLQDRRQETQGEMTARALWRLCAVAILVAIISTIVACFALYQLVISPLGGVGDLVVSALLWGLLFLAASPAPLFAMRFFGIRPARKTYLKFAFYAFLVGIGLRIVTGVPELIRAGSSQAHEIEVASNTFGAIFTEDGTPLRCRPTGDLEDEDWFPFVYPCDGNNPGYSTQSGEPGRGLTPLEARKWLKWKTTKSFPPSNNQATVTAKNAVVSFPYAQTLEELIFDVFAKEGNSVAAKMVAICREETGLRHYNDDGTVFRGKDNLEDMGLCQVNATYHAGLARNLGFDPHDHTPADNVRWAYALYQRDGFDPWKKSVAKIEANRQNGGFRKYAFFYLTAPGNGKWGDVVNIHVEVERYVREELARIGIQDEAYANRLIRTARFSHLDQPYRPEDKLWAKINNGKEEMLGYSNVDPWHTFQMKTTRPEPYGNKVWVFFPAAK